MRGAIELWAGVECTVNRVGGAYRSQIHESGHVRRLDDLDRLAELGVRAMRYPVIWELVAPDGLADARFAFPDERLARLRDLGVRPIVGLVHHGSGPRDTSLLDPSFPEKLAAYARLVAERYPWVEAYTPVNEPLTTARFSALYGHWYPHARDARSFVRALLQEARATALAMRAIRAVAPGARLVQTEDVGRTWSTPRLAYQAEHEGHRRWLSLDLLFGRVGRDHPLYDWLVGSGASPRELAAIADDPCPPDVVGLNHYVTSERFLDERVERYPARTHGGNGRDAYADVEAVRVLAEPPPGHEERLTEAWRRYGRPVAITEAHLGGTRDEQLRWLAEAWHGAHAARARGADVVAVTVWAALGSFDWDSLVTEERGSYEPGLFDVRGPSPRPTALARLARALGHGERFDHPALAAPGWWRAPRRLAYPPVSVEARPRVEPVREPSRAPTPPVLVTGASGTLGAAFARACAERSLSVVALRRGDLDITDPVAVGRALDARAPWAVVNAAGFVRVDDAERDPAACLAANAIGPAVLASACRARGVRLLTFSTDLVFDGARRTPYVESDGVAPLGEYGRSKAVAERAVLALDEAALVVRTAAFFGPWDSANVVARALADLEAGRRVVAADDQIVTPTYVPDLVHAALDLLVDGERGLVHLANRDAVSFAELVERAAVAARLDAGRVLRAPSAALGLAAPRPSYSALASARGFVLAPLDDALARLVAAREEPAAATRFDQEDQRCAC
jgi:dTDP-4-dehydrorhamnose reductase